MDHWISIFCPPKSFLTDIGDEFVNREFVDMAEKFNIVLKTTAAESAWSNGLCQRHNGINDDDNNPVSQEIYYGSCDPAFDLEKQEEIDKLRQFNTLTEVSDEGEKTISTR